MPSSRVSHTALAELGEWDESLNLLGDLQEMESYGINISGRLMYAVSVLVHQGKLQSARELMESIGAVENSEELQARSAYAWAQAMLSFADGDYDAALQAADRSVAHRRELGNAGVRGGLVEQLEAAMCVDTERARVLVSELEEFKPGETSPFLVAQAARFRARLSPTGDDATFHDAAGRFREIPAPFYLAVTLLEHGESLTANGRITDAAPLFAESREIFERLGARPWLERLSQSANLESVSA